MQSRRFPLKRLIITMLLAVTMLVAVNQKASEGETAAPEEGNRQ